MSNTTILLVEDNPNDAELAIIGFERHHLSNQIIHVKNGQEALDYLFGIGQYDGRDILDLPHLVLLDLKLPKVDGIEVLRQLRGNTVTRRIPVVVLTSSLEPTDLSQCYDLGVNGYVRKPVDFQAFSQAVEQLGMFWLLLNERPPIPQLQERT